MEQIEIRISREPGTLDIELPSYQSDGASGMDVRAAVIEPVLLEPGAIQLVPTGLRVAVPKGYEMQARPRSGLALKYGVTLVNTPGTIDADYRGPVGIILGNFGRQPFEIQRGDRIAQLVIQRVVAARLTIVESLDETVRGEGGFGSSGLA